MKSKPSTPQLPLRISLADALFSGTQQRVLTWLFGQPDRNFYANELIALTASGSGAVQRELLRLVQSELVTCRAIGRQKHYQANPRSPIFAELCAITQKTMGLALPVRLALAPVAEHIRVAFVYGSVAKRQDTASSDIDLMVISDTLTYGELYSALDALTVQLGRTVNPTLYAAAEWQQRMARGDSFVHRVQSQDKIWVQGGPDELAQL